jgi:hypothetical protein
VGVLTLSVLDRLLLALPVAVLVAVTAQRVQCGGQGVQFGAGQAGEGGVRQGGSVV